jgi:serine/threonine protein kinase
MFVPECTMLFVDLTGSLLGGRYRVGKVLGRGGMGVVYEAVQEGLERKVALKVMHAHLASDSSIRERFKREARAVAKIRHPNVVQINDYVEHPGEPPFLVMERLHGETLRDAMKNPPVSSERVVRIALQVLAALDAAHKANVVHRDLKPDNVFLEHTTAQRDIVKLLDFGVAKFIGEADDVVKLTRVGHAVGTPGFMSPEQAMGDPVDGRSDLYMLGATMFVALTGRGLYDGANEGDLVKAILTYTPPLVSTIRPDVDPKLAGVIARALEKAPAKRYASAIDMTQALGPAQEPVHDTVRDPVLAPPPAPMMPARTVSGTPIAIAVLIFGVLILTGGVVSYVRMRSYARAAPATTMTVTSPDPVRLTPEPVRDIEPLSPPSATVSSAPLPSTSAHANAFAPSAQEPRECGTARLMKSQGQDRQAAQLALVCMRKGGAPPF